MDGCQRGALFIYSRYVAAFFAKTKSFIRIRQLVILVVVKPDAARLQDSKLHCLHIVAMCLPVFVLKWSYRINY